MPAGVQQSTITCPHCHQSFELDQALESSVRARYDAQFKTKMAAFAQELAEKDRQIAAERQRAKAEVESERAKLQEAARAEAAREANAELDLIKKQLAEKSEHLDQARAQELELRRQRAKLQEEKGAMQLEIQRQLDRERQQIEEKAAAAASERFYLKQAELEKQLSDTTRALEDAQRKARQGSQQNQGEVLELDLEAHLIQEFPFDGITEVKKGQRGADITQQVRNQLGRDCGTILWETKNGKWQPAWITKFKADIREAGANIGVLVSEHTPEDIGELKHVEGNVWVASPRFAVRLAAALRVTILQVDSAVKMNAGKDEKMEALYQFLVGPEFKHRVEAIIESYSTLQEEIEKEKRAYALKWARQEKAIRAVIDNTIGMYGSLQGVTNRALPVIHSLELPEA